MMPRNFGRFLTPMTKDFVLRSTRIPVVPVCMYCRHKIIDPFLRKTVHYIEIIDGTSESVGLKFELASLMTVLTNVIFDAGASHEEKLFVGPYIDR